MDDDEILAEFTIPTPCPRQWDDMSGGDRKRYCEACGKHVYNLSAMSPEETASLTSKTFSGDDELCGRLDLRPDGKLFASDDPPALPGGATTSQFTIRWLMIVIAACATVLGITKSWLLSPEQPKRNPPLSKYSSPIIGKMMPRRPVAAPASGTPSCAPSESPAPRADG